MSPVPRSTFALSVVHRDPSFVNGLNIVRLSKRPRTFDVDDPTPSHSSKGLTYKALKLLAGLVTYSVPANDSKSPALLDEDRHLAFTVHPSAKNLGEQVVRCFIRHPWFWFGIAVYPSPLDWLLRFIYFGREHRTCLLCSHNQVETRQPHEGWCAECPQ